MAREKSLMREHAEQRSGGEEAHRRLVEEAADLRERLEGIEGRHHAELEGARQQRAEELEQVHARVRQTVGKKNEEIRTLQDELQDAEIRYAEAQRLLKRQREEMISANKH